MKSKTRSGLGFALLLALLVTGIVLTWPAWSHSSDPFEVRIQNNSAYVLTEVELNGEGAWSQPVPDIPAGATVLVLIDQTFSESGLAIRFTANHTEVSQGGVGYVMASGKGSTASFTVDQDLNVVATFRDAIFLPF